tara:strand:+ start:3731 stop:3907 length:177 start_codon:yes stop_codon:yes gene_type:complete
MEKNTEDIQLNVTILAKDREIVVLKAKITELQHLLTQVEAENKMYNIAITKILKDEKE